MFKNIYKICIDASCSKRNKDSFQNIAFSRYLEFFIIFLPEFRVKFPQEILIINRLRCSTNPVQNKNCTDLFLIKKEPIFHHLFISFHLLNPYLKIVLEPLQRTEFFYFFSLTC